MNCFSNTTDDCASETNPESFTTPAAVNEQSSQSLSAGVGRRSFLRGGAIAAGGAAIAMYGTTEAHAASAGPRDQMRLLRRHESDHVQFLVGALGSMARPKPTFQNLQRANLNDFLNVALALENTGSGAYLGAAPAIFSPMILAQAGSIALTEARHIGFLNAFRGRPMTENLFGAEVSFELPLSIDQVVTSASPFIASLNGGAELTFSSTPSAANDVAILNFALALEYLEKEFYDINVVRFYGV